MGNFMSAIVLSGDTSGAVTVNVPAVAGTNTVTIPAAAGTVMISGNMPTFSATSNANQTITGGTFTLVSLQTKNWDTATAFNNTGSTATLNGISVPTYAFAPPIAGYYQVNYSVDGGSSTSPIRVLSSLYKNGSQYKFATNIVGTTAYGCGGSGMVYLNGTTDYIQMYAYIQATTAIVGNVPQQTFFEAFLVRTA
jgi:hypothetical protein